LKKRILLITGLVSLMMILAGCTEVNQPITAESEGFWNTYIVYPLSLLIITISEFLETNKKFKSNAGSSARTGETS
jgi:YidC/Oxa1 family membrane protein insertase